MRGLRGGGARSPRYNDQRAATKQKIAVHQTKSRSRALWRGNIKTVARYQQVGGSRNTRSPRFRAAKIRVSNAAAPSPRRDTPWFQCDNFMVPLHIDARECRRGIAVSCQFDFVPSSPRDANEFAAIATRSQCWCLTKSRLCDAACPYRTTSQRWATSLRRH